MLFEFDAVPIAIEPYLWQHLFVYVFVRCSIYFPTLNRPQIVEIKFIQKEFIVRSSAVGQRTSCINIELVSHFVSFLNSNGSVDFLNLSVSSHLVWNNANPSHWKHGNVTQWNLLNARVRSTQWYTCIFMSFRIVFQTTTTTTATTSKNERMKHFYEVSSFAAMSPHNWLIGRSSFQSDSISIQFQFIL